MTKIEIIRELPKLSPEERYEIKLKIAELDGDDWLDDEDPFTSEQKAVIEARLDAHDRDPGSSIPWDQFKEQIIKGKY